MFSQRRPANHHPYHQSFQRPAQRRPNQMNMPPHSHSYYYQMNQSPLQQKKPSMIKSAFIDENGSFDVGKTLETVDQVMRTVHQARPLIQQVSSFFIKK